MYLYILITYMFNFFWQVVIEQLEAYMQRKRTFLHIKISILCIITQNKLSENPRFIKLLAENIRGESCS